MTVEKGKSLCVRNVDEEAYDALIEYCNNEGLKQGPVISKMIRYYFGMDLYPRKRKASKETNSLPSGRVRKKKR